MPDIIEDIELEGKYPDSPRNTNKNKTGSNSNTNNNNVILDTRLINETFTGRLSNDSVHEKVTSVLTSTDHNANLDRYSKNLIRFNDEINNVKSERKRKPQAKIRD